MTVSTLSPSTARRDAPRPSTIGKVLWWFSLLSCLVVIGYAVQYFLRVPPDTHFSRYITPLRFHIAGGIGALLTGPWQFSERLRAHALNFHRWLGRFYLISVGVGSIAGFAMARVSKFGMATHLGFGILAILWFFTGLQAYRSVRGGNIEAHRDWMRRNFALTLAAITLRYYLPLMLGVFHWSFHSSYVAVAWLCWVPNLLVAEWLIRRQSVIQTTVRTA